VLLDSSAQQHQPGQVSTIKRSYIVLEDVFQMGSLRIIIKDKLGYTLFAFFLLISHLFTLFLTQDGKSSHHAMGAAHRDMGFRVEHRKERTWRMKGMHGMKRI